MAKMLQKHSSAANASQETFLEIFKEQTEVEYTKREKKVIFHSAALLSMEKQLYSVKTLH